MIVDVLFFTVLEWLIPRDTIHYVDENWSMAKFEEVRCSNFVPYNDVCDPHMMLLV